MKNIVKVLLVLLVTPLIAVAAWIFGVFLAIDLNLDVGVIFIVMMVIIVAASFIIPNLDKSVNLTTLNGTLIHKPKKEIQKTEPAGENQSDQPESSNMEQVSSPKVLDETEVKFSINQQNTSPLDSIFVLFLCVIFVLFLLGPFLRFYRAERYGNIIATDDKIYSRIGFELADPKEIRSVTETRTIRIEGGEYVVYGDYYHGSYELYDLNGRLVEYDTSDGKWSGISDKFRAF